MPTNAPWPYNLAAIGDTHQGTVLQKGSAKTIESGRRALLSMGLMLRKAGATEVHVCIVPRDTSRGDER